MNDLSAKQPLHSSHLTAEHLVAAAETYPWAANLSELEAALTTLHQAFSRWTVQCMTAAGHKDFSHLDVLILHHIRHRNREKTLAQIADTLNIRDLHTVNYAIKKLVKLDLVTGNKVGKEMFYATTGMGNQACDDYAAIRNDCLLKLLHATQMDFAQLSTTANVLSGLTGQYGQASRAASTL